MISKSKQKKYSFVMNCVILSWVGVASWYHQWYWFIVIFFVMLAADYIEQEDDANK